MNRPSASRPSYGSLPTPGSRPGGNVARPNPGVVNRPNLGINRPNPGINRPGNIANVPNRPATGVRPGGAPSRNELQNFLDIPGTAGMARPGTLPSAGTLLAGGAAAQFLHENATPLPARPGTGDLASNLPATRPGSDGLRPGGGEGLRPGGDNRPGKPGDNTRPSRPGEGGAGEQLRPGENRPGRPGDNTRPGQGGAGEQWKPGDWANHRPDRIPDRDRWNNWRNDNRNDVWNHWHNHWHDYGHWFTGEWWNRFDHGDQYYPGYDYWAWAAWPGVSGWVDYGWTQPIYYNYGDNVYYDDGSVYYGDQAEAIAKSAPETKPDAKDWMPLGVFAITTDGKPSDADPTMYLQLSVSKQGLISGALQNTATDTAQSIEGMVDKQTQRAAWTVAGKERPIMETGISNLTQDTVPALVHFADGTTQQWLLVRLDKPKDADTTQTK
jgi:hypothetical protein